MSLIRKLIHLAMSAVPFAAWFVSFDVALGLAGVLLGASVLAEAARHGWPAVNRLLWRLLPGVFRAWEGRRVLGSTWFSLSMVVCLLLFGGTVGGTAILFLAWGDVVAEVVGRWARRRRSRDLRAGGREQEVGGDRQRKTVAGSVACLAACLAAAGAGIGLAGLQPGPAVVGAVVAALVERWSPPPDDNVWMPLLSGVAMFLLGRL